MTLLTSGMGRGHVSVGPNYVNTTHDHVTMGPDHVKTAPDHVVPTADLAGASVSDALRDAAQSCGILPEPEVTDELAEVDLTSPLVIDSQW